MLAAPPVSLVVRRSEGALIADGWRLSLNPPVWDEVSWSDFAHREALLRWLDARGHPYKPMYDKGGESFLWYLVRMLNVSWMRPNAGLWMTYDFHGTVRLSEIRAGEDSPAGGGQVAEPGTSISE